MFQPPKGFAVRYPVDVALKGRPNGAFFLRNDASFRMCRLHAEGRNHHFFKFFSFFSCVNIIFPPRIFSLFASSIIYIRRKPSKSFGLIKKQADSAACQNHWFIASEADWFWPHLDARNDSHCRKIRDQRRSAVTEKRKRQPDDGMSPIHMPMFSIVWHNSIAAMPPADDIPRVLLISDQPVCSG